VRVNHVDVGDLVKFKVMMSLVGEEDEVVIKVVRIWGGNESCHVGFLPRHIGYGSRKDKLKNKYAQVLEPCWCGFVSPLGRYP
jgi:hypothetical protein